MYFQNIREDFEKKFNTQHSLLAIFEKWKKVLDNGGSCGALLIDLSKAFDCIVHDLYWQN